MPMKTAEEYVLDWRRQVEETDVFRTCEPDGPEFRKFEADFYRAIQLDAMKEGARRAAEVCVQYKNYGDLHPPINTYNAILTTAKQWTEKDL